MDKLLDLIYDLLKSVGIEPMNILTLVMIIWVAKDSYGYKKEKNWSKQRTLSKVNFISRFLGMLMFICASIGIYYKTH